MGGILGIGIAQAAEDKSLSLRTLGLTIVAMIVVYLLYDRIDASRDAGCFLKLIFGQAAGLALTIRVVAVRWISALPLRRASSFYATQQEEDRPESENGQ